VCVWWYVKRPASVQAARRGEWLLYVRMTPAAVNMVSVVKEGM